MDGGAIRKAPFPSSRLPPPGLWREKEGRGQHRGFSTLPDNYANYSPFPSPPSPFPTPSEASYTTSTAPTYVCTYSKLSFLYNTGFYIHTLAASSEAGGIFTFAKHFPPFFVFPPLLPPFCLPSLGTDCNKKVFWGDRRQSRRGNLEEGRGGEETHASQCREELISS